MRKFLVIGFYDDTDDYQRFAQEFEAADAGAAEQAARDYITEQNGGEDGTADDYFHIAGIVELQDGQMVVVD